MFKKIKNFYCKIFNIKACKCDDVDKNSEPKITVHEEDPTHCKDHTRFRKSCPQCVAILKKEKI